MVIFAFAAFSRAAVLGGLATLLPMQSSNNGASGSAAG